jgi:RNA polymerase sigma-70 factor (ECF subfamily)
MSVSQNQATLLLGRLNAGDGDAARELLPLLYDELRSLAARQFRGQPANHTLQPTVLVHEAFMRLVGRPDKGWNDRKHFFAVAATAMRQILVNHARAKNADKRGGGQGHTVVLNDEIVGGGKSGPANNIDVLDLNDALEKLATIDPRKHRVVELRFFAGLTVPEVAEVMELSVTSIESEWRAARAWLSLELSR